MVVTANSLKGQIDQLENQFKSVKTAADTFDVHQGRSNDLLADALQTVFVFGEGLLTLSSPAGTSIIGEFFRRKQFAYNKRTQDNVYIGLVKLAFPNASDSSRSQYAKVLEFANFKNLQPNTFKAWLTKLGGIEKCRDAALDEMASSQRTQNNSKKAARLTQAVNELSARPASQAVSLPPGVVAPPGFAIVLAKIDSANNASIVQIVESDSSKVEPVLIQLSSEPAPQAPQSDMDRFYRAVDVILGTTPSKAGGKDRDILVVNTTARGKPVAIVQAVSEAYHFPGAVMTLVGHVGALPDDQPHVLSANDAARFLKAHDKHANWALNACGVITADDLDEPFELFALPDPNQYRVADTQTQTEKQLRTNADDLREVIQYIESERADNERKNAKRAEKKPFAKMIGLSVQSSRLDLKLPSSARHVGFAETGIEEVAEDRTFAVSEVEQLAGTLVRYGVDADGWLLDGDVDDAGLALEAYFDDDLLRVVLPTRTGADYNPVCKALA